MAINLDRFYTYGDPNIHNRIVGKSAVDDFFQQGLIRGNWDSSQKAYFTQGRVWAGRDNSTTVPNKYWIIRVDPNQLNTEKNPLYESSWKYHGGKERPHIGGILTIQPKLDAGTTERLNPANRKGIEIKTKEGLVAYDRKTPFLERPLSTHFANLKGEARIIGNQQIPHAGKALGSAGAIWQMARQYQAATGQLGDSYWDKEYGESDPLALRPLYDIMLGNASFKNTINNPEWVKRNPLAAAVYGAVTGGNEYSSAFADAYVPEFIKEKGKESIRTPKQEYSPVSQPMR